MEDVSRWARKDSPPPEERETDWEEVVRAQGEDTAAEMARAKLAVDWAPFIYWTAGQLARQFHDALDCGGEMLLRLLLGVLLRGLNPCKGGLAAYLRTAIRNHLRNEWRDRHPDLVRALGALDPPAGGGGSDDGGERHLVKMVVEDACGATERRLRGTLYLEVFLLWIEDAARDEEGWPASAAEELGLTIPKVRYRLGRALSVFLDELRRRGIRDQLSVSRRVSSPDTAA